MPAIPLAHAMVVWTPNTELWANTPNAAPPGSIAVVHHPDDRHAWARYPLSHCAGSREWTEATDEERYRMLAELVAQLVTKERLNPDHVSEALKAIEGIENLATYHDVFEAARRGWAEEHVDKT